MTPPTSRPRGHSIPPSTAALPAADAPPLTVAQASHFAALALKGIAREYPNKQDHVINDASDLKTPRALHPAFYGCPSRGGRASAHCGAGFAFRRSCPERHRERIS